MPVLVGPDRWQAWLTAPPSDVPALLAELAVPRHQLVSWPVNPAVGSVHVDGPGLLDAVRPVGDAPVTFPLLGADPPSS